MAGVVSKITTAEDKVGGMGMPFRITLVSAPHTHQFVHSVVGGWLVLGGVGVSELVALSPWIGIPWANVSVYFAVLATHTHT